jgi:hypothetical protein
MSKEVPEIRRKEGAIGIEFGLMLLFSLVAVA